MCQPYACVNCGQPMFESKQFCSQDCYDDYQLAMEEIIPIMDDEENPDERADGEPCDDVDEVGYDPYAGTYDDMDCYVEPYDCDLWHEC